MLDRNDVFHGFEWMDLALKYEKESAQDYFRDILSEKTPLTMRLKTYYQHIKQHAQADLGFADRTKHLFKGETVYYKDNVSEATFEY